MDSFAGVGLAKQNKEKLYQIVKAKKWCRERWKQVKVLIIDEVSMIGADLFEKVEYIARKIRNSEKPFGGVQVILCGDFMQCMCLLD
jgi:ATP-dependent DNA helicase PIF1